MKWGLIIIKKNIREAWCWKEVWCLHGFLTSGHHWPAGFAAADLSWAASDHRLGSDWFAQLRHYTHTVSRAHPESKKESGGTRGENKQQYQEEEHNSSPTTDYTLTLFPLLNPGYESIPLLKLLIIFVSNHCPGCRSGDSLFPCNHCIITQRCLLGPKTCPIISLRCWLNKAVELNWPGSSAKGDRHRVLILYHWPFSPAHIAKWYIQADLWPRPADCLLLISFHC